MKKILIIFGAILLSSCHDAKIYDAIAIEQINVLDNDPNFKYEVKLKTAPNSSTNAYFYTNYRFQVLDTFYSNYEVFAGRKLEYETLQRTNDSLTKELAMANYYLSIFKEKMLTDTAKKR